MDFNEWTDKILMGAAGGMATWLTLLTKRMMDTPRREEVIEMVQTHSPYKQDRADIRHQLEELKKTCDKLDEHLDSQSSDLHTVSTEIVKIRTILDERARQAP